MSCCGHYSTIMSPSCRDVAEGHSLERRPAGLDTNQASDFVDNAAPSPGYGLPPVTPTPTPTSTSTPTLTLTPSPTPAPTSTPLPSPTASDTPAPQFTPQLTPTPNLPTPLSADQDRPWLHFGIPSALFLIGLTLFAFLWLKKQS